jgi:L-ascorbate metabolism protein UlaG (beta-lactamase superfamily)
MSQVLLRDMINKKESYMLEITHLHHSGFLLSFTDKIIIIDAFTPIPEHLLSQDKKIFFFATHSHSDHYSSEIFDYETNYDCTYILSSDIHTQTRRNVFFMDLFESMDIENMHIETYGTTDQGTSFYIEVESWHIFHAGDLNWWHWAKRFDEAALIREETDFKREVDKLTDKSIDIAFVPVDPRLDEYYYLAAEYFIETIKPKILIPMHFRDQFQICLDLKNSIDNTDVYIPEISGRNTKIQID